MPAVIPAQAGIQEHPKMWHLPFLNARNRRHDGVFRLFCKLYITSFGALDPRFRGDDGRRKVFSVFGKDEYRFNSIWTTPQAGIQKLLKRTVVLNRFIILSLLYVQRIPDLSLPPGGIPAKGAVQKLGSWQNE